MNAFQILGISLCGSFALLVVFGVLRKRMRLLPGAFWTLLWTAGAVTIAEPEITVVVAQSLGIDRGADLIFYLAILFMFVGFFLIYIRLRRIDEGLTTVVRRLAIAEARDSTAPESASPENTSPENTSSNREHDAQRPAG